MRFIKILILFITLIILIIISTQNINIQKSEVELKLYKQDLKDVDNLMIIAHPDDDLLWGGYNLIKDDYLVVCITCDSNKDRTKEFKNVMNHTNDRYIVFDYPDKVDNKRADWTNCYDDISSDIDEIINYKEWKKIVTHNPDGEYGHIHHSNTSKIVTNLVDDKNKLYYFNKYYTKDTFDGKTTPLNEEYVVKKENLLKLYSSQKDIIDNHYFMIKYEKLILSKDWK